MKQLALLLLAASGCDLDRVVGLTSDPGHIEQIQRPLRFSPLHAVDMLLVLDDSPSMAPKQAQLRERLPQLMTAIAQSTGNLSTRLGVITTDLGAPGISCGVNRGAKLAGLGAAAGPTCKPPVGSPWLTIESQPLNLPAGQTLEQTLDCMTAVGDDGCGFEMPLEATYRFFTQPIPENAGFLREGAITVVVLITDEDDCSADPQSNAFIDPQGGPVNSFRCARFGLQCDGSLVDDHVASFATCQPAEPANGSRLVPIERYIDLFGGKDGMFNESRGDVIVAALRAPPTPVSTVLRTGSDCGPRQSTCTLLAPSCSQSGSSSFTGDPAVRINAVLTATGGIERSICDGSYQPFATDIVSRVQSSLLGAGCLPGALLNDNEPDCTVAVGGTPIPRCRGAGGPQPCWDIEKADVCPPQVDPRNGRASQQRIIVRGADPAGTTGSCAVLRSG